MESAFHFFSLITYEYIERKVTVVIKFPADAMKNTRSPSKPFIVNSPHLFRKSVYTRVFAFLWTCSSFIFYFLAKINKSIYENYK